MTKNTSKHYFIILLLILIFSSCSFTDSYEGDRIFLDFNLGMTYSQFNDYRRELDDKNIARTIPSFDETQDFKLELYLIGDIKGMVHENDLVFEEFDGGYRLTRMDVQIRRDSLAVIEAPLPSSSLEYKYYTRGYISSKEKRALSEIFVEKYGKSQIVDSKDLLWAFPSVQEPKYICRLDTTEMVLSYYYNEMYLVPRIEKREKERLKQEMDKTREAI